MQPKNQAVHRASLTTKATGDFLGTQEKERARQSKSVAELGILTDRIPLMLLTIPSTGRLLL